jgi:oligoribonuclease
MAMRLTLSPKNLVFIDLEMTGFNPDGDRILEIAVVVTDKDLRTRIDGPSVAIRQTEEVIMRMDLWNRGVHTKSGLLERSRKSRSDEQDAEEQILDFLRQYVPAKRSPMCGNVLGLDRRFLAKYMPELYNYFSYKDLDATSIETFCQMANPDIPTWIKRNGHTALADCHEAIDKINYYRKAMRG